MSTVDWRCGDVAMVRNEHNVWNRAICALTAKRGVVWVYGVADSWMPLTADARPLVVIDPEDREAVERLYHAYLTLGDLSTTEVQDMQAALREFAAPTPPKPEVLRHYVGGSAGGLKTALCGKRWRLNAEANVTVLGNCPTCHAILRDGTWSP